MSQVYFDPTDSDLDRFPEEGLFSCVTAQYFNVRRGAAKLASTYLHESSARFVHRYSGALRVHPFTRQSDWRGRRTPAHHRRHPSRAENEEREASSKAGRFTSEEGHRTEFGGPLRRGRQKSGRRADQQR